MFRVTTIMATKYSLLQESYCSNSKKKKFTVRETVGGLFVCLLSKISFRELIRDALMGCVNEHRNVPVNYSLLYFFVALLQLYVIFL